MSYVRLCMLISHALTYTPVTLLLDIALGPVTVTGINRQVYPRQVCELENPLWAIG